MELFNHKLIVPRFDPVEPERLIAVGSDRQDSAAGIFTSFYKKSPKNQN